MYNRKTIIGSDLHIHIFFCQNVVLGEINGHLRRSYCYECIHVYGHSYHTIITTVILTLFKIR